MQISETKIRTIKLDAQDLCQEVIMYLKARNENVDEEHIEMAPGSAATATITAEITPK